MQSNGPHSHVKDVQNQKGLISAMHSNGPLTPSKQFGLPDKMISDRGPQFASKAFIELLKLLGIKSALSTAYHTNRWNYRASKSRN